MQPEEFMGEFFRERTERIRAELVRRESFRQKFYTRDCYFDSQRGAVEQSEAEKVLDVSHSSDGTVYVITNGLTAIRPSIRVRYHLQPAGEQWLIREGELECSICQGTGKTKNGVAECPLCKGRGWSWPKNPNSI